MPITLTVVDGSGAKATATNVVTVKAAAVERDRVSGQLKRGAKVLWRASGALGSGDFAVTRDGKGVKRVQGSGGLPDGTTVTLVARRTGSGFSGSVRVDDGPQRIGPTLAVRRIVTLGGGKVRVEAQKTVGKGKQRKTYKLKLTLLKDVTPK